MLQLHIDGQRVNLPEGMSTEYNVLNPFFSNEGDYTLDIDISLDDPENARVYHNIHRIDHTRRTNRRTAILSDETGVIVKGLEVLLEINGHTAKIQIIGGVSELNYLMGDQTLQQLDLWMAFDESEVVFPPVCVLNDSPHASFDIIDTDEWVYEEDARVRKWRIVNKPRWQQSDNALVESHELGMPYMWAVVRRVVQALGFEVGTSVLETDTRFSQVIMIHGYSSRFIAEKLPAWTVSRFFEEIQKFFNVIITVDKTSRRVDIVHAWDFFSDSSIQPIRHENVVTPLDKQFDTNNDLSMVDYSAVRYNFTNTDSNKYLDLEPDLEKVCDVVQAQTSTSGGAYGANYYNGLWKALYGNESFAGDSEPDDRRFGSRELLRQTFNGEERTFVWWVNEDKLCGFRMVDQFARKTSPRHGVEEVTLNIVPVRMVSSPVCGGDGHKWQYPMPAVNGEASSYKSVRFGGSQVADSQSELSEDINSDIKSGYKTEEQKRTDTIFVAFWMGNIPINWEDPAWSTPSGLTVPMAAPDSQAQLACLRDTDVFWKDFRQVVLRSDHLTMAINGAHGMDAYSYSKNPSVDATTAYTIKFRCTSMPDIRKMFLIENRKFYCKELKFRIDAGSRSEVCEGTFFPVLAATGGQGGGGSEGGETIHYVEYNLDSVVIAHRIYSVVDGDPLHLDLSISGGNASHRIHATVTMAGVDITATVFAYSGRTATIDIASVTGDIHIQAWRGY